MLPENIQKSVLSDSSTEQELQISQLQQELKKIQKETDELDTFIRTHLSDEIVELQELLVIDKMLRQAKKLKRIQQKQKGKKLQESQSVKVKTAKDVVHKVENEEETILRRKLYKEAMVKVHPDKFATQEDAEDLATELTIQLIETYKNGTIEQLTTLHAHITSGNAISKETKKNKVINEEVQLAYLTQQIKDLEAQIQIAKRHPTYQALQSYSTKEAYLLAVKEYLEDRLFKLRKRTRKYQ